MVFSLKQNNFGFISYFSVISVNILAFLTVFFGQQLLLAVNQTSERRVFYGLRLWQPPVENAVVLLHLANMEVVPHIGAAQWPGRGWG